MRARYPGPLDGHPDGPRTGPAERLRETAAQATIDGVHRSSTSAVRLLAAWQQRRRELSDRLDTLLLHGPTAVDRVASRADELRRALDAERAAFEAFVGVAEQAAAAGASPVQDVVGPADGLVDSVVDLAVYPRLRAVTDVGV